MDLVELRAYRQCAGEDRREPGTPAGIGHSLNDPVKPQALDPTITWWRCRPPIRPPSIPTRCRWCEIEPIEASTMATNRAYRDLPEIKGTVWKNYMPA